MRVLFLCNYFAPRTGGVEKHLQFISRQLVNRGYKVAILTRLYRRQLRHTETIEGATIYRFFSPTVKYLGLLYIWYWLFKNRKLIEEADIVHCHDVFIWYFPFCFLYPKKPIYTTMHGWEGKYPIPLMNLILKRLASRFSRKVIAVGNYIEKYYGIKADLITYGAVDSRSLNRTRKKVYNSIVFLGRLEKDTGITEFLDYLRSTNKHKVIFFCGDGSLREECARYGQVLGFTDPKKYLSVSEICVPGGYLSAMEAVASGCTLKLFWSNKLKEDYWKLSPFLKLKGRKLRDWVTDQTWSKLANQYIELWNS